MPSSARTEALRGRASRPGTSGHELAGAARAGRRGTRPLAQLPQRDAGGVTTTSPGRGRSDARLLSRRPPPRGRGYRCAGTDRCRAAAFSASSSASSCAEPMCSILRDPRREDQTIWTAVAPDAVFTVRTYATRRDYEPQLSAQIRRLRLANQQLTALRRRRPARASSYRPNDGLRRYMTAASDKDLHGLWRASRTNGAAILIDALLRKSPLKAGLDRAAATDIVWILTASDIFWRLVHTRRWSHTQFRAGSATRYANSSCRQPDDSPDPDMQAGSRIDDGPTWSARALHNLILTAASRRAPPRTAQVRTEAFIKHSLSLDPPRKF